ncbi:MAG: hypothetical protein EAY75_07165 [Bacteroidetes bacterium]|nr:MAG: hypothetical protein EAY75_07165 [Bacteroidota bacterium]
MHQVDVYIETLPPPLNAVAAEVRQLLFEKVPHIEERFSFKLPFYHYLGMFCYLRYNPELQALDLTFTRGKDLQMAFPQLELRNRATGASAVLKTMADITLLEVPLMVEAAADWQQEAKAMGRQLVNKKAK